jgi:hypothetical protein
MNNDDIGTDVRQYGKSLHSVSIPSQSALGNQWKVAIGRSALPWCILIGFIALRLQASQPAVSYRLLGDGGSRMLSAPVAVFSQEIELMNLAKSPHRAVPSTNSHPNDAAEAELFDLKLALRALGHPPGVIERIVMAHAAERETIRAAVPTGLNPPPFWSGAPTPTVAVPILSTSAVHVVDGLPMEFANYFRGAIAWHGGATNAAIAAWEGLLGRPEGQRRFRSTWAAFMLGKALWETEPKRALKYFQQVRSMAQAGFSDRLGLAAASLGWEARIELRRERFERAIVLYLEQAAAGDDDAYLSLHYAAAVAHGSRDLRALARHPTAQRVITAYVISGGWRDRPVDTDNVVWEFAAGLLEKQSWFTPTNGWHRWEFPTSRWLEAMEATRVRDPETAEKLALAAYQFGDYLLARRWLNRAGERPVARWLRAKLALQDGQLEIAFGLLSRLIEDFKVKEEDAATVAVPGAETLLDRLVMADSGHRGLDARRQVLAEWAALQLVRKAYAESLDAFMRSGHWYDAAYVADRVLTVDELKSFIDRSPRIWASATDSVPSDWLAWRLIRAKRFGEARIYLKEESQQKLDAVTAGSTLGRDPLIASPERANALWAAANAVMKSGLELFNAPAETDWGSTPEFWLTNTLPERLRPAMGTVLPVTGDEERRVIESSVYPNRDWYYRSVASELAWEAASLMPDNSVATAHLLWRAGTWLKYADPKAADRFYKALVRRCGRTDLGREAERRRWFPSETVVAGLTNPH